MNRQTLVLIVAAFLCTVITPLGYAKSSRYLNGYNNEQYEGNPKLIKLQEYKLRPTQRRQLMHQRLNRVKDQFLSLSPIRNKDAALSNLEKRISRIKEAK